jgi:hypothetical protein
MNHHLSGLPLGSRLCGVTAKPGEFAGRRGLRVELTAVVRAGQFGIDFVDQPTFVLLPDVIRNGTIEVDLLGTLAAEPTQQPATIATSRCTSGRSMVVG